MYSEAWDNVFHYAQYFIRAFVIDQWHGHDFWFHTGFKTNLRVYYTRTRLNGFENFFLLTTVIITYVIQIELLRKFYARKSLAYLLTVCITSGQRSVRTEIERGGRGGKLYFVFQNGNRNRCKWDSKKWNSKFII